jgi:hypothetical protein
MRLTPIQHLQQRQLAGTDASDVGFACGQLLLNSVGGELGNSSPSHTPNIRSMGDRFKTLVDEAEDFFGGIGTWRRLQPRRRATLPE